MTQYSTVLLNGTVLTMDAANRVIENGAVGIRGDKIVFVGPIQDLSIAPSAKVIDARKGVIMPGLINTHTHAAMTCFRGLADDLPLMTWLNDHIFPAEARLDQRMVYHGTRLACAEMLQSGTTCFGDMYLFEDAVATAAKECGMRAVVGEVLYDFPSPNYGPIDEGFDYTQTLLDKWRHDSLITIAVEPHSPYLCSPSLLRTAHALAVKYDCPLIIHVSETQREVQQSRRKTGQSPVGHLAALGVLGPRLLACHCVVLSDEDIDLLRRFEVKVAHCPESNMKLASGVSPVWGLVDAGICVGLGTDGCASNNNLDLFSEMETAAKLQKVHKLDPTVLDAQTVLRMATTDGARALGLGHVTGSLEVGKKADIIVIDCDQPHLTPMYSPFSHAVYAFKGSDVRTTMVDGHVAVSEGRLTNIVLDAVSAAMHRIAGRIHRQNHDG